MTNFEKWWNEEGSAMLPTKDEDYEEFAKRVSQIAWSNGAYKATEKPELVAWGVDWGKAGDISCVSIIKRLPNGVSEVVAVEYAPY